MAHFKRYSSGVKAYYYDNTQKKSIQIPRAKTRHLDNLTDDEIRVWLEQWETDSGIKKSKSRAKTIIGTDEVADFFENYQTQRRQLRNVAETTLTNERSLWNRYVLPYFVVHKHERNVRKWHFHTAQMSLYLKQHHKLTIKTIKQIGWLTERFGKYLVANGILQSLWVIPMPILNRKATTPLKIELNPAKVMKFAGSIKATESRFALAILLGYFAGLRPGETFALLKEDFLTGDKAKSITKTYNRLKEYGLGSGLTVFVSKALKNETGTRSTGLPKTHHSYGFVNIWDVQAAREIADILKTLPMGKIFVGSKGWLFKQFAKIVADKLDISLHDLRRASALYLGRTLDLNPLLLQDHMRHSDLATTMIYTRRPLEEEVASGKQNLNDVG